MSPHMHSGNKKYFQEPFLVLQLITNRGLVSVLENTTIGIILEYHGPDGQKLFILCFSQVLIDPSMIDQAIHTNYDDILLNR